MGNKNIVIIDYGIGNVKSMYNAIIKIGFNPVLTSERKIILNADFVILPGVGAFGKGMQNLKENGLDDILIDFIKKGKPFLGVCLGMQLLFEESEEFGKTVGLGLIKGKVLKLPKHAEEKLPHVSWNQLIKPTLTKWDNSILNNINNNNLFYFVHSFVASPFSEIDILARTNYAGIDFCSAVNHENIYGTQFHPEKSGPNGLKILSNFLNILK
jgi:glutamine amidotransferase